MPLVLGSVSSMEGTHPDQRLYELMHDMGDSKVNERARKLVSVGKSSETSLGSHIIAETGGAILPHVREMARRQSGIASNSARQMRIREMLRQVGPEQATALSVKVVLNALHSVFTKEKENPSVPTLQTLVGDALRKQADLTVALAALPEEASFFKARLQAVTKERQAQAWRRVLREKAEGKGCDWSPEDVKVIGAYFVELLTEHTELLDVRSSQRKPDRWGNMRWVQEVQLSKNVQEWWDRNLTNASSLSVVHLPITTPPLDWDEKGAGGYPAESGLAVSFMLRARKGQREAFRDSECPRVLQAVSTAQRTGWRINSEVLKVFKAAYKHEWHDVGCDPHSYVQPQKPDHPYVKGDAGWQVYGRQKRVWEAAETRYRQTRLKFGRIKAISHIYEPFERFYFVHQIDFRGRLYPCASVLNYQGCDLERGLLQFAEGKPLGSWEAWDWFWVHGANVFGNDKVSLADRQHWGLVENIDNIVECAEDPYGNRWWTEADKPWQFLAWCFEVRKLCATQDPLQFVSHLPIAMDGSNNGLQIYSIALRDQIGARATNCTPAEVNEEPRDAYQEVADAASQKLRDYAESGADLKKRRWARRVLDFCKRQGLEGLPRAATKRPVMTQPYGATKYSCQAYVVEWYHDYVRGLNLSPEEHPFPERDSYKVFRWVGDLVWDSISDVVVKACEAMDWIQDVADLLAEHKKHLAWTTPLGLKVRQEYKQGTQRFIQMKMGRKLKLRVWEPNDELNTRRSRNGACPNFVHSLDASVMFETVNRCSEEGVTSFQMIHDSFATHAADAPKMARVLREVFVDFFSEDVLQRLREESQAQLPEGVTIPEPPPCGDYDLTGLSEATYFFA